MIENLYPVIIVLLNSIILYLFISKKLIKKDKDLYGEEYDKLLKNLNTLKIQYNQLIKMYNELPSLNIDTKTKQLLNVVINSSTNDNEARTAAMQVCKRLNKK